MSTPSWQKKQEQEQARGDEYERQLRYWVEQLEGSYPAEFLYDKPRNVIQSEREVGVEKFGIDGSLYERLESFCEVHQVSPFVVMLAAFRAAHYRLTGVEDATVGAPIVRDRADAQATAVNLQCIRIRIEDKTSFAQLVQHVDKTTADASANSNVPFEAIVSEISTDISTVDGPSSSQPLTRVAFSLPTHRNPESLTTAVNSSWNLPLDLELRLVQEVDCLSGAISWNKGLFDRHTITSLVSVFQAVIVSGLAAPHTPLSTLPLQDDATIAAELRARGILDIQCTGYARDASVIEVFRHQVARVPHSVAVRDAGGDSSLTYAQLDEQSEVLASWLTGIKGLTSPGGLVGVLSPRSSQAVVAFLGILKANLAYVPLDFKAPPARIETVLEAMPPGRKLVLLGPGVSAPVLARVAGDVEFVSIDDDIVKTTAVSSSPSTTIGPVAPSATSLAYIMFTSGSTGKPKGVMIEHRGIVRMADMLSTIWGAVPVAQLANIAFDTSTAEIYTPLLSGGTVVCIDENTALDSVALGQVFKEEEVEVAVFTPAVLKECLAASPATIQALRTLFIAGDRADIKDARRALQLIKDEGSASGVFNSYGPTENSVLSTLYRIRPDEPCVNGVPIGRAITNSGAYVMDPEQRLVPIGVLGELVVTGDGVARGYTDPERDRGRFVQVTIDGQPTKAYRTGDYVRYRPTDCQLEFFGRLDYQVKIRGQRVELPEIEHELLAIECVTDAVTVVRSGDTQDDAELVSFVTVSEDWHDSSAELQDGRTDEVNDDQDNSEQGQVDTWREHFNVMAFAGIDSAVEAANLGRDFFGWTSMYDGAEMDRREMEEWLDDTMTALLDGGKAPRNVLEIGTGSGMILFNLPTESLQSYVGLELAEQAVRFANKAAKSVPGLRGKVDVRVGTVADLASHQPLNNPDLVVVNSVAQYFPTPEYLLRAIEDLARLDGVERIFFGDVRSYALYREFQVTHALHRNNTTGPGVARMTRDAVLQKMVAIERTEEELLVDPAFFTALEDRLPDLVDRVEILPKRMKATNELSRYRYAAVIHVKSKGQEESRSHVQVYEVDERQWIDFTVRELDRESLLRLLLDTGRPTGDGDSTTSSSGFVVAVGNIPNSKTIFERCVLVSLDSSDTSSTGDHVDWIASCRHEAASRSSLSVTDLHEIAAQADFRVEVSWARQASHHGGLDAIFHRHLRLGPSPGGGARVPFRFPTDHAGRPFDSLNNRPLRQRRRQRLEEQLRARLRTQLPSYMVPSVIRVLDRMPLNPNGKVDRRELARVAALTTTTTNNTTTARRVLVPPRNDLERALCEEFAGVLGTPQVGTTDNFYDLGGHSLQAARLVSRINRRLGLQTYKLYIFDLVSAPTPTELGQLISSRGQQQSSSSILISGNPQQEEPTANMNFESKESNSWNYNQFSELHTRPNSRATIVLVHGLWGQGSIFLPLVPLLDDMFDVLLIHDPFFGRAESADFKRPKSIRQWAELYLDHVVQRVRVRDISHPGHALIFGGYSLGGLIAYEMASLWRTRHQTNKYPASLVLLDAATYSPNNINSGTSYDERQMLEEEREINYGLTLFGESQRQMVLDHFHQVVSLAQEPVGHAQKEYQGKCLGLVTPESAAAGATEWWLGRCPGLTLHEIDCAHHDLFSEASVEGVGRLVNEHCCRVIEEMERS